jgi:hypothetical protein
MKVHRAMNREAFDAIADETKRQGMAFAGHVPLVSLCSGFERF